MLLQNDFAVHLERSISLYQIKMIHVASEGLVLVSSYSYMARRTMLSSNEYGRMRQLEHPSCTKLRIILMIFSSFDDLLSNSDAFLHMLCTGVIHLT